MLPIFLLVLFGIIDGGRMIFVNNQLSEAARDGARWGSVAGALDDLRGPETPSTTVCSASSRASPILR